MGVVNTREYEEEDELVGHSSGAYGGDVGYGVTVGAYAIDELDPPPTTGTQAFETQV